MKALILAAGLGSRMQPLTDTTPKPLLPFMNVPLIDLALAKLEAAGIREQNMAINTHHLSQKLVDHLVSRKFLGLISHEPILLGTGGAVKNIEAWVDGEDLLIYNSDIITDASLAGFVAHFDSVRSHCLASMLLLDPPEHGKTPVLTTREGQLIRFENPENSPHWQTFTGIHIVSNQFIRMLPTGPSGIIRTYEQGLAEGAKISTEAHKTYWKDLGTPNDYWQAHLDFLQLPSVQQQAIVGRLIKLASHRSDYSTATDQSSRVSVDCRIGPNAVILGGTVVGAHSQLSNCLVYESTLDEVSNLDGFIMYKQTKILLNSPAEV